MAVGALIWGSSFLLIAESVEGFPPIVVAILRIAFGAAVVAAFPRAWRRIAREDLPRVWFLAIVWMVIPFTLFPIAEQSVESSVAGVINAALPVFAAVIAWILLRRPPSVSTIAGISVGFAGVVLVALPTADAGSSEAVGVILLVVAVALYGIAANVGVPLQQKYGALPVLLRVQLAAVVLCLPPALWRAPDSDPDAVAWISVVLLGTLGTGVAFIAIYGLIGRVGATRGTIVTYFFPVVAVALGVALRDETLAWWTVAGTALIIIGAWLAGRAGR